MNDFKPLSFLLGLALLFLVYHFPEFFQAFWIMALFKIGFLLVAYLLARVQGWRGLEGYGLGLHRGWWKQLAGGLISGAAFFILSIILSVGFQFELWVGIAGPEKILSSLPMILLMTAFPSIAEDILTRGYLQGHLKKMGTGSFVLVSAAFYVLNHIWRLQDGAAVLTYLFLLGLVLAYTLRSTGYLWLAFGIHWGANIGFELSRSAIETQTIRPDGGTWMLALCWGALLLILFFVFPLKNKTGVV